MEAQFHVHVTVGFPQLMEECYKCAVICAPNREVRAEAVEASIFDTLITCWRMRPGLSDNRQTVLLDFSVSILQVWDALYLGKLGRENQ